MTNKIIRLVLFILSLGNSIRIHSQPGTIFFSTTGDTICYSDLLMPNGDESLRAYIKCKNKIDSVKTISTFLLDCDVIGCIESLHKDSVKKYNLEFDGSDAVWGPKNDFVISIKPINTKLIDTSAFGPKFIYQSKVSVIISCKGQNLYSKEFEIMFKANSPKDFPKDDVVRIKAWRKKNTNKYFVMLSVKEKQIFKKPGDLAVYEFKSFQYIL